MFEALCEDIKLNLRNFDEQYGKSFHEAIENFNPISLISQGGGEGRFPSPLP